MSKEFLVLGDSNVRRYYIKLGTQVKNLEFVQARNLEEAETSLQSINVGYKFIVFAFITNLIVTAGEEASSAQGRLNAIQDVFDSLLTLIK